MREAGDAGPGAQGEEHPFEGVRLADGSHGLSLWHSQGPKRLPIPKVESVEASEIGALRRALARLLQYCAEVLARGARRLMGLTSTVADRIDEADLRLLIAANSGTRHVGEVMVPRTEVTFLGAGLSVSQAVREARSARHSRFPIFDDDLDDVIGFVHLRDLTLRPQVDPISSVRELAREVKRLPASKRVLAALSEMRREGHHLAVVVDEYGGTAGIVTLEDLIEELVGEIHDEYDLAPDPLAPAGALQSEVDGLLNLADFAERTGVALPHGPYETVGGFLMARLGKIPVVGDEVPHDDCRLVVSSLDGRRVARVSVVREI